MFLGTLSVILQSFNQSVQFSHSVMPNSLQPHGLQHAKPPYPSPTPRVYSNSCPLSWWCHPTILSSVVPFSSCLQSFPASGSFQMSQFFHISWPKYWSFSFSNSPSNEYSGLTFFRMDFCIFLQSKGLSRVFPNTIVQNHQFFGVQLSLDSNSHIHTWLLEKPKLWLDEYLLAKLCLCFFFNMLSRLVITFLPRSKRLLISWLKSQFAVILEPKKIKSATVFTVSPSIWHEVMGPDAMILVFWVLSFKPTFSLSSFTLIKRLFSSSLLSAIWVV